MSEPKSVETDLVRLADDHRQLHASETVEVTARALASIEEIAKHILDDDIRDAYEGMHAVAMTIDIVRGRFQGKLSAEDALAEIDALKASIMDIVDKKFDDTSNL